MGKGLKANCPLDGAGRVPGLSTRALSKSRWQEI